MSGCHDDSVRKSSVTLLVNACCACSVEETGRVICGCPNGDKILPKLIQSRTCEKESRKHKIRCVESVRSDEQICNGLGSGDMLVKLLFQAELRPGQKLEKVRKTAFLGHIFVGSPYGISCLGIPQGDPCSSLHLNRLFLKFVVYPLICLFRKSMAEKCSLSGIQPTVRCR